jgi:hypothetical protein
MDKSTLVSDRAVRADKDVICDRLAEDLDFENVRDYFLRLAIDIWMHERDVVVAGDDVSKCGEPFFDAL